MKPAPLNATFLDIPLPPSTNNLFVNVVGKGRRKSGEYKSWCNAAAWKIRASDNYARFRGPFSVEIVLPPDIRIDPDNAIKPLIDALKVAGVIVDDGPKYQRGGSYSIGDARFPNGGCMVTVRAAMAEAAA